MKIPELSFPKNPRYRIIIGVLIFFIIGFIAYLLINPQNLTRFTSSAVKLCDERQESICKNRSKAWNSKTCTCSACDDRQESICKNRNGVYNYTACTCSKQASTTQNCEIKKTRSFFYINNVACKTKNTSTICNNVNYCCAGSGQRWTKCSSAVVIQPPQPPPPSTSSISYPLVPPPTLKKKAAKKTTKTTQACNDNACASVQQGTLWGLNNCKTGDPDGDMQLCDAKGRIGECRGKKYCCPGSGQKWTSDMTNCPITQAILTASPLQLSPGQFLTATWSAIPAPSGTDWLGMYRQGEGDERNIVAWNYVNSTNFCTKTPGDGKATGTCSYEIPITVVPATYELRMFTNNTFTKLATSNVFTVSASITPPPGECCACPTPTPLYSQSMCNGACMTSQNCPTGQVCLLAETYGWVCRNPACGDSASCSCTAVTPSPTPTPRTGKASCDEQCASTSECRSGYRCAYINNQDIAVCRNPKCFSSSSCVCSRVTPTTILKGTDLGVAPTASPSMTPTPTGLRIGALPTGEPTPSPMPINPALTIKPFTDSKGISPQKFTLAGTSDPFTEIDIRFDPDALGQTTTADAKGNWRYILTKSLSSGTKELTVTAKSADGGETVMKQSFTAKSSPGGSFFSLFLGFLFLAAIGGIGYFIYKRQMTDQSSLFSQFPPVTSPESSVDSSSEKTPETLNEPEETMQPPEPFISPDSEIPSKPIPPAESSE